MAKTEIDSKAAEAANEEQVKETETQAEAEAVKEKEASSEDAQAPEGEKEKKGFFSNKKDKKDEQIEELTDRLKRTMAEFDNFRKRTEKEKSAMYEIGAKDIIEKILPVVDNFERGLATIPEGEEKSAFAEGMDKVYKQLVKTLDDAGFTAYSGEILGIAGIAGSGQKELLETIAGLQPMEGGTIRYYPPEDGEETLSGMSPAAIRKLGIKLSFVPEDRLGMGLVAAMGMTDNMMLRGYKKGIPFFTDRRTPKAMAEQLIKELEIVTPGVSTPVGRLSGGNVQKVLVGREISSNPRVLMVAYPVRGLDINSSYTIYHLLNEQKKQGAAVICVGEDLDVLLELCDRILVLCGGKVSGIVDGRTATKEEIGLMMTKTGGGQDE